CRSLPGVRLLLADHHIGPQRLDLFALEHVAPRRHLVLAVPDRADEAVMLVVREAAQIEGGLRVKHVRPVARGAVTLVDVGAHLALPDREAAALRLLTKARRRQEHGPDDGGWAKPSEATRAHPERPHSGIRAKVQTDPPCGTFLSCSRAIFHH